ncbi:N-acetylmuramoyl-L-alanine amidase [Mobilitalea sibirica]|uniref:N-acetylmuramoyl-L-alanine amidase n=2 Tax=Mobilitalea sibirica TaxID=1462919 RepID=A0A8J7H237_9FIRM|nr:N-acetylmuramoyl-L-alanine amidase [Mobilitalea sibirica]
MSMKKYFTVLFLFLVLLVRILSTDQTVRVMNNIFHTLVGDEDKAKIVIVIDPGHGGRDPGKVGVNKALEKDINLNIAFKLKALLELNDIKVIMTREEDIGLYSETDSNKKMADLRKRIEIIHSSKADIAISIHQNSFTQEYVKGAQVFYHSQSDAGRRLSIIIQEQIKEALKDDNHRKAKSNSNYYMLKKTECPLVIVECGYMSNQKEAALLIDEAYQEKLAWGIHMGIMKYINEAGIGK